jgi:hypothetical protein
MPVYHYSEQEKRAYEYLNAQNLLEMVVDDPLLVLEIKKVQQSNDKSHFEPQGMGVYGEEQVRLGA